MRNHEFYFNKTHKIININEANCEFNNNTDIIEEFLEEILKPNLKNTI